MALAAAPRPRRVAATPQRKAAPVSVPPADRRRASQPGRPPLRVVDDKRVAIARRRRRLRAFGVLAGFIVVCGLFALAAFHAMLASGQAKIDDLEHRVGDAQAQYEHLRLQVAELEAPDRIVREARERLGMVPPPGVTYLTPSDTVANEVGQAAAVGSPSTSVEAGDRAAWAAVKPYLSGRP